MIQEQLDNMEVSKCKTKRKDHIAPLITLQNKIKIDGQSVSLNPTMFFTRLTAAAHREEEDIEEVILMSQQHGFEL